ncbi:MAG: siderophore-interacting protein [Acidimicrobiia bacterium]
MQPPPTGTNAAPAGASARRGRLADIPTWTLEVVAIEDLSPSMRLVRFTGPGLDGFTYRPGQDLMITFPGDAPTRRRYTIRRADPGRGTVDIGFALHGTGPATRWVEAAGPGDRLEALGPRGNVVVDEQADWHLFVGDDSAVPAVLAMIEDLAPGTTAVAFLEVDGPADEQDFVAPAGATVDVRWLHRSGEQPGRTTLLRDAVAAHPLAEGPGHVYLAGEVGAVFAMRGDLLERGCDPATVDPKGYWSLGKGNLGHGEPERPQA